MGLKRTTPLTMPAAGVIKGGRLDGWRYHFLQFKVAPDGVRILARCSAPRWPFPCDIALNGSLFGQLRPVASERAKHWVVGPMIRSAYAHAGLQVPAAFEADPTAWSQVRRPRRRDS